MNAVGTVSSSRQQVSILIVVGLICTLGYGYLAIRSNNDSGIELFDFLGSYWAIGALVFAYWLYLHNNNLTLSYGAVVFWAVVFRLIGIVGSPILEDDFYRYLLDGCVFLSTGSPYGITPESLFQANSLSKECQAALTWVNNPDLPTIYAPLLQYIFALAHIISTANINLLQLILALFDIGLILILCRFAPAKNVLLYAWNPLILKEIAFTAHPDIIGVFFLMAAFAARHQQKSALAAVMIALACACKIFAVIALPYFLYKQKFRYWLLIAAILVVLYLPFLRPSNMDMGNTDMLIVGIFAQHWQFNATVFQLFRNFLPDLIARGFCLGIFVTGWGYYFYRYHSAHPANDRPSNNMSHDLSWTIPRFDWIFGVFFLLSPVANPWYMIWLLPFAVLRPSYWAWTLSLVVSLTYITGINLIESDLNAYEIAEWAYAIEIAAISVALFYDYRKKNLTLNGN